MKYIAPTIVNQHSALAAVLGPKGNAGQDSGSLTDMRTTSSGYESDE